MTARSPENTLRDAETYLASCTIDGGGFLLDASGAVLYTDVMTLRRGPVYFLGLNPGGTPETHAPDRTLRHSFEKSRAANNAFLDEDWTEPPLRGGSDDSRIGKSRLQLRVQTLFSLMGLTPRNVPASNLVFTRSRNLQSHENFHAAMMQCKPAHEIFVDAIQPDLILTHGGHEWFRLGFDVQWDVPPLCARHGKWKIRLGECSIGGRSIPIVNLPHLSLWAFNATTPMGHERTDILKKALQKLGFGNGP